MQLVKPNKNFEQTLEGMFTAKYSWLLRWALHFAQNDAAAAEDLVQETFVRILLLKDALRDLDNIEPLLYTHLRYAYLTERRKGRNHAFQSPVAADFDTLSISLRTSASFDQIEVQNDLRKILVFLLWRRRAAKFANIFLLRFFHEFSHEEVAALCVVSRHAVDLGLARAREELKSYMANPQQIRVLGRGNAPEYKPLSTAMASDKFAIDMMAEIFGSPYGACPGRDEFDKRYRTLELRPLDNDLITHVVSCRPCLDRITRILGSKPPSSPSAGSANGATRSTLKPTATGKSEKKVLARIFHHGRQRLRETFHHYPSDLVIALNAEVVAVRDISSPRSVLKVETRSAATLELIEIFSEQGLLLLMLPIVDHPPQAPPELKHEIEFSGGRLLTLTVRFTGDGALIEATYLDPDFTMDTADEEALVEESLFDDAPDIEVVASIRTDHRVPAGDVGSPTKRSFWQRLFQGAGLRQLRRGPIASAAFAVLVAVAIWICIGRRSQPMKAESLVRDAMRSESRLRTAFGPGVVHQEVEIRAARRTLKRDVYRDLDGRRHPRPQPLDHDEQILKAKLAQAEYDWDDPLSAASFEAWRERFPHQHEEIRKTGSDLLTVTTTAASGPLLEQSITIRLGDLHPVARNLVLPDQERIQVAEVSYEVVSWGPAAEGWFEPLSGDVPKAAARLSRPPLPAQSSPLSENELDVAELSVQCALQELHADTERLQVSRTPSGIAVTGIVESDGRKLDLSGKLRTIAHVTANISSYHDIEKSPHYESEGANIKAITVAAEDSPLDRYCEQRRLARDVCRESAHQILSSSTTLVTESGRLADLRAQYPASKSLSRAARVLLDQLIALHVRHLFAAIHEQEDSFPALQLEQASRTMEAQSPAPELHDLAQRNLKLVSELVYAGDEQVVRDAPHILQDLATSAQNVQAALSRMTQFTTIRTEPSPIVPTPNP
jgi:RNA polymerase sigma factor (sigma-70 family)